MQPHKKTINVVTQKANSHRVLCQFFSQCFHIVPSAISVYACASWVALLARNALFVLSQSNRIARAPSIQIEWATSPFKMNGVFERD
jgi:hypothetical protein